MDRRGVRGAGQRDADEPAGEGRGQRPRERGPADAGRPGKAEERGRDAVAGRRVCLRRGLAGHQVVQRLVLLTAAADVFPVEGLPKEHRVEPLLHLPAPRESCRHLEPRLRGHRLGVGRMQAQDAVPLPRERVPDTVGQRVVPRRSQKLRHREAAAGRGETGGLAGDRRRR